MGFFDSFKKKPQLPVNDTNNSLFELPPPPVMQQSQQPQIPVPPNSILPNVQSNPIPPLQNQQNVQTPLTQPNIPETQTTSLPIPPTIPSTQVESNPYIQQTLDASQNNFNINPNINLQNTINETNQQNTTQEVPFTLPKESSPISPSFETPFQNIQESKPFQNESPQPLAQELPQLPKKETFLNIPPSLPPLKTKYFDTGFNVEEDVLINKEIPKFEVSFYNTKDDELPFYDVTENIKDDENFIEDENFKHRNLRKPLFVRTDVYSHVLDTIDTMKNYVAESIETVFSLENLKKNADIEFKNYKNTLEDMQRKLIYIDKILFEKGALNG